MSSVTTTARIQARLEGVAQLTPRVLGLRVEAPESFSWEPGQHVALGGGENGEGASYYSIASAPIASAPGVFEIAAGSETLPAGLQAREGETFLLSPAQGKLPFARLVQSEEVVLVGMGTGVSPLRSVVQAMLMGKGPRVTLYQGARTRQECLFFAELSELVGDRFAYRPVLSREGESWSGLRGRVQDHLREAPLNAEYCLCGSKPMVGEVGQLLHERGVAPERIYSEGY